MDCVDIQQQFDDLFDDGLSAEAHHLVDAHIQDCITCQQAFEKERSFRQLLRTYPVPSARPEFTARLITPEKHQRPVKLWQGFAAGVASTAAASVLIFLMFSVWLSAPMTSNNIELAVNEQRTINLVLNVTQDLPDATLSIVIPNHIELAGYPNQRSFIWQENLVAGNNVLSLPVVAIKAQQGQIVTTVKHGQDHKRFQFMLTVISPRALDKEQVEEAGA